MKFLGFVVASFLGCCAAVAGVWSADRTPATDTISVKIVPEVIEPGQAGEVQYVYQRFRLCQRRSTSSVIDASGRAFLIGVQSSPPSVNRVEGKQDTFARPFRVSMAAQPGPAVYQVVISDSCNPLHRIWPIMKTLSVPFVVGEGKTAR